MIRRHSLHLIALFALLLTLGIVATPQRAAAQYDDCICDFYIINVDINVGCSVTVCMPDPANGSRNCITIAPGTRGRIPCIPGSQIGFRECTGQFTPFTPNENGCQIGIGAGPNCCVVDACLSPDSRCPVINITPSAVRICPCP